MLDNQTKENNQSEHGEGAWRRPPMAMPLTSSSSSSSSSTSSQLVHASAACHLGITGASPQSLSLYGGMGSSVNTANLRPWTEQEIAEFKAQMWGDMDWNGNSSSAPTTWDENISLALQENELHDLFEGEVTTEAPEPGLLPLPFLSSLGGPVSLSSSSSSQRLNDTGHWWMAVKDNRMLRGRKTQENASSSSDGQEKLGITSRFGRVREGVDRWHHPDGSVRSRLQERISAEQAQEASSGVSTSLTSPPDQANRAEPVGVDGKEVVKAPEDKSRNNLTAAHGAAEGGAESSTTVGDDSSGTAADAEDEASSSSESTWSPGFYRYGEWQPRERTPQELRQHLGGRGAQRTQRRQERLNEYFRGLWRPAWLVNYRRERDARRAAGLPKVQEDEETAEHTEQQPAEDLPADEDGETEDAATDPTEPPNPDWTHTGWHSRWWDTRDASWDAPSTYEWDASWTSSWSGWIGATCSSSSSSTWNWQADTEDSVQQNWTGVTTWATQSQEELEEEQQGSGSSWEPLGMTTSSSTTSVGAGDGSWRPRSTTSTSTSKPPSHVLTMGSEQNPERPPLGFGAHDCASELAGATEGEGQAMAPVNSPFPHAWGRDVWTLTLTSSTTTQGPEDLPNHGLFPAVRPARLRLDGDETGLMRITNSEIALLQEGGAGRQHIRRVTDLLELLDAEQVRGTGAEARWSLARLLQRVADAQETIEVTMRILRRRLRARGVLPIQRVPRQETERWRRFMWSRQFAGVFRDCLEMNIMTPLQPGESDGIVGASSSSSDEHQGARDRAEDGSSPPTTTRARSRSRSRASSSWQDPDCDSEFAFNSEGEIVHVPDGDPSQQSGPPPPLPANFVSLEPVGIWREPVEDTNNTAGDPDDQAAASTSVSAEMRVETTPMGLGGSELVAETTTTSTGASSRSSTGRVTTTTTSLASPSLTYVGCLVGLSSSSHLYPRGRLTTLSPWSSSFLGTSCQSNWSWRNTEINGWTISTSSSTTSTTTSLPGMMRELAGMVMFNWTLSVFNSSTTSTTTSSTVELEGLTWPADIVRDAVNTNLIHGGTTDVVQFVHLMLARQRRLRHMDRLIGDAVTEALNWLQVPLQSEAMNAATYDTRVWQVITHEARFGSGPSETSPSQVVSAPSVLLQPGFPSSLWEMRNALPGTPNQTLHGYRRRAWRQATGRLFREAGREPPVGIWPLEEDMDLFLVQRREEEGVPNWPDGVPRPAHPVRNQPGRDAGVGRRRLRQLRPRPRWSPQSWSPRRRRGPGRRGSVRRGSVRRLHEGHRVQQTRERSRSRDAES